MVNDDDVDDDYHLSTGYRDEQSISSKLHLDMSVTTFYCINSLFIFTGTSALSTSITITGTGFSSVTSENDVTIADVACTVTSASTTSIECDIGNGPIGTYPVIVNVDGKGDAAISGTVEFTYTADISGIVPSSGSLGGTFVFITTSSKHFLH